MDANRFYSIPYDARNDTAMIKLRRKHGGMAAFGRWQALLGVLFDEGGIVDLNDDDNRAMVESEIELKGERLDGFVESCVKYGLLDETYWAIGKIGSHGVCEELEYRHKQSEKGKKGAEAKKRKAEGDAPGDGNQAEE